jgi:N-acetylmuramoyl-L-alanine amidase
MSPARLPHSVLLYFGACLCLLLAFLLTAEASAAPSAVEKTAAAANQSTGDAEYQKAADQCHRLLRNPSAGGQREDWLKNIQELERIYRQAPQSHTAPACLHLTARMRQTMHQRFHQPADLDQATALFSNVISLFPQSSEAAESLFALAQIEQTNGNLRGAAKTYYKLVQGYPFSSRKAQAEEQLRQLTVIAESLAVRKEGKKTGPILTPKPMPPLFVSAPPAEKKPVILPQPMKEPEQAVFKPAAPPVFKPFVPAQSATPPSHEKEQAAGSAPQFAADATKQKLVLPLPAEAAKPVPPKAAAPVVNKKKKEEAGASSLLGKIGFPEFSFSLFGSEEEKKDAAKPATSAPKAAAQAEAKPAALPVVQPEPSKAVAAVVAAPLFKTVEPQAAQSKIVVSKLKIASVEPDKPAVIKPTESVKPPAPAIPSVTSPQEKVPEKAVLAELLPIQHWSSDSYSRVAVSASSPAVYKAELPDSGSRKLKLEFKQSHVPTELRTSIAVDKGLIKNIRAEQADDETVRVSLELAEDADCKIFSLNDPFRVVVDLHKVEAAAEKSATEASPKELTEQEKKERAAAVKEQIKIKPAAELHGLTLAQQLGLGIRRIMIDPGHGGKDSGAIGFGLEEKRIVLDVAKRVRELLKKEKYEVLLTREQDVFLPLEERTALANTKGADLFLSIHVNAHPKASVKGVETYYLNLAANPEAMRVAALENATSSRSMSEMQDILASLMKNSKIDESSLLAEFIQTSMADGLRRPYKIKNLGVKKAPFYVLIGAQMPAALAEISFISNKDEAALLKNDQYLQAIAKQIAVGVIAYIEHRRTAATPSFNPQEAVN